MGMSRDSKTKNSSRNIVFGFILKIYQLLMPFIIRTIIIYVLGIEYAGLNSLFTSILSVLNIAELGVGTIMVFYIYKPIEENDTVKICALMKLYKIYYRIIGAVVLGAGLAISPFLKYLVKGDVPPDVSLYVLYYLNLSATVLSYWLFAYKNSLFQAHQRNDVVSKVTILTDTVKYFLQISLLFIFKNYYTYVIVLLLIQVLNNIIIAIQADKAYPNYRAIGVIAKSEQKKINASIRDVFYGQLGNIITLSVDSIVISAFLGLVPLARYQNYYFVVNALIGFFSIFYQSLRASIGTNLIVKNQDNNYKDFKFITFTVMSALTFCTTCMLNLFQPFIELWVGKENLLDNRCVILLVIYFFTYEFALMIGCYKDISGKWHADRFRSLITAIINLVTNIIMVQFIGLYGILLSTIISFWLINIPWLYKRVFIDVFENSKKVDYAIYLIRCTVILLISVLCSVCLCGVITINSSIIVLTVRLGICVIVNILVQFVFNRNNTEFRRGMLLLQKTINRGRG